jgi:hypothetical protein
MSNSNYYTTQDAPKTLEQMVACARREFELRKKVYPKWVQGGRMSEVQATHEIECMEGIYYTLFRLKELQDASEEMKRLATSGNKNPEQAKLL